MTEAGGAKQADVVVVGAGLAGHCTALAAAEAGARVLLLEKQPASGGSTVLSGGFFAFADTPPQRDAGITDTPGLLLDDLRAVAGGDADEALIGAYAHGQRDLFDWLTGRGVRFGAIELSAGQSVARSHRADPVEAIAGFGEKLAGFRHVEIRHKTPALRLLTDSDGAVRGVRAQHGGESIDVTARGGVVLTSGGFARSASLLHDFAPDQAAALRVGGAGNVGDGLRMAWKVGAGFRDMAQIKGTFGTHPDTRPDKHEVLLTYYLGAIIVNRAGRRFVDESLSYKILGDACLGEDGALAWQVFDDAVMRNAPVSVPLFDPRPALEAGLLLSAGSLDALAAKAGMDAAGLKETVERYNTGVAAGRDPEFGRDGLCNHAGAMVPIAAPPFYAYPSTTVVLATYCGLTIDAEARVLDPFGETIDGLFAAGEITGGFHGRAYMTGTSLGKAAFFGRRAGRAAAARAGKASA